VFRIRDVMAGRSLGAPGIVIYWTAEQIKVRA
jgi:hypothetical protein